MRALSEFDETKDPASFRSNGCRKVLPAKFTPVEGGAAGGVTNTSDFIGWDGGGCTFWGGDAGLIEGEDVNCDRDGRGSIFSVCARTVFCNSGGCFLIGGEETPAIVPVLGDDDFGLDGGGTVVFFDGTVRIWRGGLAGALVNAVAAFPLSVGCLGIFSGFPTAPCPLGGRLMG
ncbi:MAG: hypothetical protein JXR76_05150 [Deltaproteobacteria bacterium]|nr:hypothetical protein [Deltaproteobacteria bacterium]